jgi:prepilin-type N-terminal cleavage/methylation domain-containing protein
MKRSAFTLIELLVTVMVLTLLVAFTIPTYQLILSQLQLNSAVEATADFVRLAAQKTVTEQQVYGVTLNTGSVNIPMFAISGTTQSTIQTYTLPANMQIGSVSFNGTNDVRFTTSGAPSISGSFTVTDTVRNRSRVIEIRPSGNIRDNQVEQ